MRGHPATEKYALLCDALLCYFTVQALHARTPCNWKVCIATLLVCLLYTLWMRGHPATEKYALMCYLSDTLQLESFMHCCVYCTSLKYKDTRPCDWEVCIATLFVFLLYKPCMRGHPATEKYALLNYLPCYCTSLVCNDTLQLASMHCCAFVPVQALYARTRCNWYRMHCCITCLVTVQAMYARTPWN